MRKYFIAASVLIVFITGGLYASAKEKTLFTPKVEMLNDATMAELFKYREISEEHKRLSALSGVWDYTLKYWTKEGSDAQLSSGAITNKLVMNGRFLSGETSTIFNIGGQSIPYEGCGLLGYDSIKKVYTEVWADSMGGGIISGTGIYDEKSKTIQIKGRFTFPMLKGEQEYRSETELSSPESYRRAVYIRGTSGKEFKVIEIEFARRK